MVKHFILTLLAAGLAGLRIVDRMHAVPAELARAPYEDATIVGTVRHPALREVSGIAASCLNKALLWMINDSGNPPELYAVSTDGAHLATFRIENVQNIDWEDLTAFKHKDVPYLMIADVGDNNARRPFCSLYVVREPEFKPSATTAALSVAWTIRFSYVDGPRDCEAVAVDAAGERVLLLSKRTLPPVLYELPLLPAGPNQIIEAKRIGEVTNIPPPSADERRHGGQFWGQPTAMDIAPDASAAVVLTYKHAYLYERGAGEPWAVTFKRTPRCIVLPHPGTGVLLQRESICFADGKQRLFVTSEGHPAPIACLVLKRP